jgi:alanyl-tRNA synthetase
MRDTAYRVIADHVRTLTFALADGAVPDKEGRGYVLRRILRRAVRYGWQYLGLHEPFMHRLVETVVATMGDAFPPLRKNPARIAEIIRDEEESFARTLDRGLRLFEEAAARAREHRGEIQGDDAFRLHDTFGFPVDLTEIMAGERGLRVNIGEYERLMEAAREKARATGTVLATAALHFGDWLDTIPSTDDSAKYSVAAHTAKVVALFRLQGSDVWEPVQSIGPGEASVVFLDRTCFYSASGGQVGDRGLISGENGSYRVEDAYKPRNHVAHYGQVSEGTISVGDQVQITVGPARRPTTQNHTATHILNWALREVLDPEGQHLQQKGSLVDAEKTRFDFSHPKPVSAEELARIESLVNDQINQAMLVDIETLPLAMAQRINGVRAVFGEKYPDQVRVVSIGKPLALLKSIPPEKLELVLSHADWRNYSVEFCGGTHVSNTRQIDRFVLISEEAVSKGIRRVVGVTGDTAREAEQAGRMLLARFDLAGGGPPD